MRNEKGQFVKGIQPWNKGIKGIHLSLDTEFKKGRKFTEGEKQEWSKRAKERGIGKWMRGRVPAFMKQGKHYHPSGAKNPNWKGGASIKGYPLGWTHTFKEQIRRRDGYKCQECGVHEVECIQKLCVHHVDDNKSNLNVSNLISLCRSCHCKLHNPRKRAEEFGRGGIISATLPIMLI